MLKLKRFLILIWFTFFVCSISVSGQNVWEKKTYREDERCVGDPNRFTLDTDESGSDRMPGFKLVIQEDRSERVECGIRSLPLPVLYCYSPAKPCPKRI